MHIYIYTCRIRIDAIIKTSEDFFKKIYLSLYLKGLCVRGSWRPNRTATYWPPLLWTSALCLSRSPGLLNRRPGDPALCWVLFSLPHLVSNSSDLQLTDFLSLPSYMIVQSPTQYLPITGHRDVSLPLSLEWHVWLSSSGNNCHAVHRSLSSGASVYESIMGFFFTSYHFISTVGFYIVPYCQPNTPTPMEYATSASLEWHVWPGRRSIYNTITEAEVTNISWDIAMQTNWKLKGNPI